MEFFPASRPSDGVPPRPAFRHVGKSVYHEEKIFSIRRGVRISFFVAVAVLYGMLQTARAVENIDAPGNSYQLPVTETAGANKPLSFDISSGYDSLYMFKGVNLEPNTGIYWVGLAPSWVITPNDSIQVPFWYATTIGKTIGGINQNYREFDVPVNYSHTVGNFSLGLGYHLFTYFNLDGVNPGGTGVQNELAFYSSYMIKTGAVSWVPSLSYYYELGTANGYSYGSVNPGSSFLSPQVTVNIPIHKDLITFNPSTQYNFSFGYTCNQEHQFIWGGNNWQLMAPLTWQINNTISITGYAAYSYQWQSLIGTAPGTLWGGGNINLSF